MAESSSDTRPRPLSPHLQVYRLPYNAVMSIVGRGVGVALSVAVTIVFMWFIAVVWVPDLYAPTMDFINFEIFGFPVFRYKLLIASFIIFFYLGNGVRHVLWDFVVGVDVKSGQMTGNIVLAVSALLTALIFVASIMTGGSNGGL